MKSMIQEGLDFEANKDWRSAGKSQFKWGKSQLRDPKLGMTYSTRVATNSHVYKFGLET